MSARYIIQNAKYETMAETERLDVASYIAKRLSQERKGRGSVFYLIDSRKASQQGYYIKGVYFPTDSPKNLDNLPLILARM